MSRQQSEVRSLLLGAPEEPLGEMELVLAFKRGEDGSYQAIYDRYRPRVKGICRQMLGHDHDAEEAQQETFTRVFTGLPRFNGRYQLGAWVSRIATNVCLDQLRAKGRRPSSPADNDTLVGLSEERAEEPDETFLRSDERGRVREVLSELSPTHRAALALREFEGMSYADIGAALNMTDPQVKALIHRARKSFKKHWGSRLALFLPWKLIARVKRFSSHYDAPGPVADAASSGAHLAHTCATALQQCGAMVADKAGGAFTALVVTTAAVGSVIAPSSPRVVEDVKRRGAVSVAAAEVSEEVGSTSTPKKHRSHEKEEEPTVAQEAAVAPAPEPTPAPEEEPAEGAAPEEKPDESEDGTQAPTYGPLAPGLGWDRGQEVPATEPSYEETSVDCRAHSLSQKLQTVIHDGSSSYPAELQLNVANKTAQLTMAVTKNGHVVTYNGGAPEIVVAGSGRDTAWGLSGSYSWYGSVRPDEVGLPSSGRFTARFSIDCLASVVITESVLFTTQ